MSAAENTGEGAQAPDPREAIRIAREQIAQALTVGHLIDDPAGPLLAAQDATLAAQGALYAANVELAKQRQEVDPAALARLEKSAASGAARYAGELARAHSLRTFLIAGGVYLASLAVVAIVSNHWGHVDERIGFQETEDQIKGAFANGPANAEAWAVLVSNNDAAAAMKRCRGDDTWKDSPSGRQVCRMVFYVEPPK